MMFRSQKRKKPLLHESSLIDQAVKSEIPAAESLYLVGQVIYDEEKADQIRSLVREHDISRLSSFNSIDVRQDIIQVYLAVGNGGQSYLIALIDPFELYMNPYIIERTDAIQIDPSIITDLRQKQGG